MEWGKSTNRGTARVKLAHQFQKHVLLKDDFIVAPYLTTCGT